MFDGARPDVQLAEKFGLRYVHLPHGYNGISESRAAELAKAVRDLDGPIYIHCHHGKHRSPTAATVACVANGMLDPLTATSVLKFAGYQRQLPRFVSIRGELQVESTQRFLTRSTSISLRLRSCLRSPNRWSHWNHTFDHLKRFAATDWKPLADHPDLDAAHEALLLTEQFTEMLRLESTAKEPEAFREMLKQSEANARAMHELLVKRRTSSVGFRRDQSTV